MGELCHDNNNISEPQYMRFNFFHVPQLPPVYVAKTGKDIYIKSPDQASLYTEYAHGTGKVSLSVPLHTGNTPIITRKQSKFTWETEPILKKIPRNKTSIRFIQLEIGPESDFLYDLTLVSHGEPKPNCGEIRAKLFCADTNNFIQDVPHRCHRAVCPICWDSWVEREVKSAAEKFLAGLSLLRKQNVKNQGHHIVWSVPPEEYYLSRKQLKTRLLYRMRIAGAVASAIIFHPFRFRSIETGYRVDWKNCSLNRNAEAPIVQSEVFYSPHFHTACVGYLMPSKIFYGGGMWKGPNDKKARHYKGFRWRYYKQNDVPLNNLDQVRGMLYYSLSHCAVADQKHALTWAQKFGNRHMLIDTQTHKTVYPKCPIKKCSCGNKSLTIIEYQKDLAEYVTAGQRELYWIVETKTTYKFRGDDS